MTFRINTSRAELLIHCGPEDGSDPLQSDLLSVQLFDQLSIISMLWSFYKWRPQTGNMRGIDGPAQTDRVADQVEKKQCEVGDGETDVIRMLIGHCSRSDCALSYR